MGFTKFMTETSWMMPITAFYGLLKGLLCVVPCTVGFTLVNIILTLIRSPVNTYRFFKAIWCTKKFALTLRILVSILSVFGLVLVIPIWLIAIFVFSFGYSLFGPIFYTFDSEGDFFISGFSDVFTNSFYHFHKIYWNQWSKEIPDGLKEFETQELKEGEEPYDVPLIWLVIGLGYALIGFIVNATTGLITGLVHTIPALLKVEWRMWKGFFSMRDLCCGFTLFIPCVVASVLLVGLVPLVGLVVVPIVSGIMGGFASAAAYKRGFLAGFQRIANNIYELDHGICEMIYHCDTFLTCFKTGLNLFD